MVDATSERSATEPNTITTFIIRDSPGESLFASRTRQASPTWAGGQNGAQPTLLPIATALGAHNFSQTTFRQQIA
ncbi:hypothetical protein NDU88_004437 [Pleurodeles waltl]|uniref:Uncharacterized protein n=1 Tax=Pleurodeles waltl TaxID=8319 RepID=A0AAV7VIB5_PLEWA|nr:hypothetical protein NDU88_004437 [Pleurodeles waltl]